MTAHITPADSPTAVTRNLILRLCAAIDASRREAGAPAAASSELDLVRAAATIRRCAAEAGLTPALTLTEAEELARAFVDGDDGPFVRYGANYSLAPTLQSELGADEALALCALLAAREQWAQGARLVEPAAADSTSLNAVCPACGSLARLEILLDQFSERYATCSACDAYWRITRVGCPHCGESDGRHVVVYNATEQTGRALVHCLSCRRAWRRLDLRNRMAPPDELFLHALEPWTEELLLDQRDDVLPAPLRPRRGPITPP